MHLEDKNLGAMATNPLSKDKIQRLDIAFVNDADFHIIRQSFERIMQQTINVHDKFQEL